jgi:putative tricarboxylic transport membrane protein
MIDIPFIGEPGVITCEREAHRWRQCQQSASLRMPHLFPAIMVFCSIGVFSINNGTFEVYEAALFCIFGYMLIKLDLPAAPLLLGLVLGPAIKENFRRAMVLSRGDSTVFLTSPLSGGLLAAAAIAIALIMLPTIRSKREEALKD